MSEARILELENERKELVDTVNQLQQAYFAKREELVTRIVEINGALKELQKK